MTFFKKIFTIFGFLLTVSASAQFTYTAPGGLVTTHIQPPAGSTLIIQGPVNFEGASSSSYTVTALAGGTAGFGFSMPGVNNVSWSAWASGNTSGLSGVVGLWDITNNHFIMSTCTSDDIFGYVPITNVCSGTGAAWSILHTGQASFSGVTSTGNISGPSLGIVGAVSLATTTGNVGIFTSTPCSKLSIGVSTTCPTSAALLLTLNNGQLLQENTAAAANNKLWDSILNGSTLTFRLLSDSNSSPSSWLTITRSGTTPVSAVFGESVQATNFTDGTATLGAGNFTGVNSTLSGTLKLTALAGSTGSCLSIGTGGAIGTSGCGTAGITALTGDVLASGTGSVASTVVKVNGSSIPVSSTLVGTNGSGQFVNNSSLIPTLAGGNTFTGVNVFPSLRVTGITSATVLGTDGSGNIINSSASFPSLGGTNNFTGVNNFGTNSGSDYFLNVTNSGLGGAYSNLTTAGTFAATIVVSSERTWESGLLGSSAYSIEDHNTGNIVTSIAAGAPAGALTIDSSGNAHFGVNFTSPSATISGLSSGVIIAGSITDSGLSTSNFPICTDSLNVLIQGNQCNNLGGIVSNSNVTMLTAAGSGSIIVGVSGTDAEHSISIKTGSAPTTGPLVSFTFSLPKGHASYCTFSPVGNDGSGAAVLLTGSNQVFFDSAGTATGYDIYSGTTALAASTVYTWQVVCP